MKRTHALTHTTSLQTRDGQWGPWPLLTPQTFSGPALGRSRCLRKQASSPHAPRPPTCPHLPSAPALLLQTIAATYYVFVCVCVCVCAYTHMHACRFPLLPTINAISLAGSKDRAARSIPDGSSGCGNVAQQGPAQHSVNGGGRRGGEDRHALASAARRRPAGDARWCSWFARCHETASTHVRADRCAAGRAGQSAMARECLCATDHRQRHQGAMRERPAPHCLVAKQ